MFVGTVFVMTNSVRDRNPYRWLVLAVVLVGEIMDLIDSTVVNVAAPRIAADFHASSTSLQWVVGGYPLAVAVGLILGGRLGDLVGRRRLFLIGMAGFVGASTLSGLAPDIDVLIAARLIQGSFAALMLPQGFGILREAFDEDEQSKAFGLFGPVIGLSAVLGPLLGGLLTDWNLAGTGWRLVFLINVPIGLAGLVYGWRVLPASLRDRSVKVDGLGTALVAAASVLVVYPLIQGRAYGWPWWTWFMIVAGVVVLVGWFLQQKARERAGRDPLVTTSVFAHRGYSGGLAYMTLFFMGLGGALLVVTLFLQEGQGFTPIHAALCLVPLTIGLTLGAVASGAYLGPKFGRRTLQGGTVVSGIGWLLVVLVGLHGDGTVGVWQLAPGLLLSGLGAGLVVAPLFDVVLASVTDRETGSASGVLNAVQQLAGSIGVAVIGSVFFDAIGRGEFHHALRLALVVQVALLIGALAVSPLLPRAARPEAAQPALPLQPQAA